jgi:hypothetical protein
MSFYTKEEKLNIILDIAKKLKNFKGKNNQIVDLYKDEISFIEDFKKISNEYIKYIPSDENNVKEFNGSFDFIELGKRIDYVFPILKKDKPLFVIRFSS